MSGPLVPALATLLAAAFTLALWQQWRLRRQPHQLLWSIGFAMFTLGVGLEAASEAWGWRGYFYRLYYFDIALLVSVLAAGTIYLIRRDARWNRIAIAGGGVALGFALLLAPLIAGSAAWGAVAFVAVAMALGVGGIVMTRTGDIAPAYLAFTLTLATGFAMATFAAFLLPADLAVTGHAIGGEAMPGQVRMFSVLFTLPATFVLVGGAVYSWGIIWWLGGGVRNDRAYNLLIAAGALVVAGSGGLAKAGDPNYLYLGELAGLALMFVGFLRSRTVIAQRETRGQVGARART